MFRPNFQELVVRCRGRLLNFITRMIGDGERADLVQEAFIRVHHHLHRFDHSRKSSTWICTIASNLARNELRKRSRSPLVLYQSLRDSRGGDDQRPLQFEDSSSRPDDMFANRHLRELVDTTVARLAEHHRRVFVLRELEGRSYQELAAITGCNLGTVTSRLNRARHAFGETIAPFLD